MVGRFVEEDDFGLLQQDFGQVDAHLPAVAELGHRAGEVRGFEAQTQKYLFGIAFHSGAAEVVETVGGIGQLLCQIDILL